MTIAAYCRVTPHQKADSQVSEITKWLNAHGYDPAAGRLVHRQGTGKTLRRPSSSGATGNFSGRSARSSCGSWIASPVAFGTA